MKNAMTIDLEDWFCAYNLRIDSADWGKQELRVVPNARRILDLLARHHTRATFFVLGWFADRVPDLVQEIERQGHEIATHGYSHTVLTRMTPETFAADLSRALEATAARITQPIVGFRAPSFTITAKTLWALDILAAHGIRYDSSVFPIGFHPDYGIGDASLSVHSLGPITEVPMSVAEFLGRRVPCSGGAYFRVWPYAVSRLLMRICNRQGRPVIFYLHPWETDPGQPRVKLSLSKSFRHYFNLSKTLERLDRLLSEFEFTSIAQLLASQSASRIAGIPAV
jgi:polysaccharide deacetylase family protein (PEP-CTERM system associated)